MATKKSSAEIASDLEALRNDAGKDVVVAERFSDAEMRSVTSYEDAVRLVAETYGGVVNISEELGNGFALLAEVDKARLVKNPFVIMHSQFSDGDYGEFVSIALVTAKSDRLILNDGSTGICAQMRELVNNTGRHGGFMVTNGLRESTYDTCTNCGKPMPSNLEECRTCGHASEKRSKGTTYYLDTSA